MTLSPYRFAFVSNSSAIAAIVQHYATTTLNMCMEIRLATMEEAVPVAQSLLNADTEVILGGGATGRLLRRRLHRPVVTLERSHLDILRALHIARQKAAHVGFTCYDTVPFGLDMLEKLMHIQLTPIVFTTTEQLRSGIAKAIDEGVQCIVGGGICAEIAFQHDCQGVIVTPSDEVMQRALEEAINIAASQRQERRRITWLGGILESLHEGVVGIDEQGQITTCNKKAVQLLDDDISQKNSYSARALHSLGVVQTLRTLKSQHDTVQQIGRQEYIVNSHPVLQDDVVLGAVAAFRPVSDIRIIHRKLKERLRSRGFTTKHTLESIVGDSPAMIQLRRKASCFADTGASVLIQGETGTGKELLAHGIHAASRRREQPFVAINCAAIPESLLESELFGHDEGAFSGARRGGKDGLFTLANEGSIFLDEIGDIPPAMQALLLRVLESGEIMRVGGDKVITVNVRVISSSWKNLTHEVRAGRFRADLYYRLATLRLHLPPLRHRLEDIPSIVYRLLGRHGLPEKCFSERGMILLSEYSWPGNIRELEALVRRYALLLTGETHDDVLLVELLDELKEMESVANSTVFKKDDTIPFTDLALKAQLERYEQEILARTIRMAGNNRLQAARMLGISANTLWRKLKKN